MTGTCHKGRGPGVGDLSQRARYAPSEVRLRGRHPPLHNSRQVRAWDEHAKPLPTSLATKQGQESSRWCCSGPYGTQGSVRREDMGRGTSCPDGRLIITQYKGLHLGLAQGPVHTEWTDEAIGPSGTRSPRGTPSARCGQDTAVRCAVKSCLRM